MCIQTGTGFSIGYDLDLRLTKTLFGREVHQTRNIINGLAYFFRLLPQYAQLLPVELNGQLRLNARQQFIKGVLDRLREVELYTREGF